jgi:shikimate kinase
MTATALTCATLNNKANTMLRTEAMTHKRIFIIGHSGAGKGVLAEALAKKLNWKYINADFGLAPSIGRPLTEIIGDHGEKSFHQTLTEILTFQKRQDNIVVSTDDSIVCHEKTRELLTTEFTVYLKVSLEIQMDRIAHNRPLLPCNDYKAFLNKLRHERDGFYEQVASFSISSDDGAIEQHAEHIIKAMDK